MNMLTKYLTLSLVLFSSFSFADQLNYKVYSPQESGIFKVSSTLITGQKDAILVDAQFSTHDSDKLVKMIQESGKNLKYILITAGEPDFYFGLAPLAKAFPQAKIFATSQVVRHIEQTKESKMAYWGPILKTGAPEKLIVPEILKVNTVKLENQEIQFKAPNSYAAYLWVPSTKTILGGVGIFSGVHVWTADTQTTKARAVWRQTLKEMIALKPKQVIPGHYLGAIPKGTNAIQFTNQYLVDFENTLAVHKKSAAVINVMKSRYPQLSEASSLELSSKVNTGEMKW
ncbi:Vmh family MBL fold metallo-hydrolase [Acinetobacter stercoris]|uniref:Metallo-beta-lactamase superfamily protein n=1 Tax=Acinetobacter stercoris TaxID=2126983 RepID=A0A2U3MW62_9GAMM|nr:Vmh family MBL fold metallo-hydrolase [Acinetobacter stercoris]SPL69624.1 Metallo-beta-lactamase superfamily protein [Acinetobacter stercoris]